MIRWIIDFLAGVELKRENLNREPNRIVSCVIVIIVSYIILGPLFPIIDNLIKLSEQPWYAAILTKYSFVAVSIRIIFLSLFTRLNNPFGRFKAAFSVQIIGFIVGVVMYSILNGFINPSPNIDSVTKFISGLLPFAVNILIFSVAKWIYREENFDEDEFFRTNSRL